MDEDYEEFIEPSSDSEESDFEAEGVRENDTFQEIKDEYEYSEDRLQQKKLSLLTELENDIANITQALENDSISLESYNVQLIILQRRIFEERQKFINLNAHSEIAKNLQEELDKLFDTLTRQSRLKQKLHPRLISENLDNIYRKYMELVEEANKNFEFESNPIDSNVSIIIDLPTPDKYVKELHYFQEKIEKMDIDIQDMYNYLNLRKNIILDKLKTHLKNDILYVQFMNDVQIMFLDLNGQLGQFEENGMDPIKLDAILQDKLNKLVDEYKNVKKTLFKKEESKEILNIFGQLKMILVKNKNGDTVRRFKDDEILNDFKTKDLNYLIDKYGDYIRSDYFSWAKSSIENEGPTFENIKRKNFTSREISAIRVVEIAQFEKKKKWESALIDLANTSEGKNILLNCANKMIMEGKIYNPLSKLDPDDVYINELFENSMPIWSFSIVPKNIHDYASTVNRLADEFYLNRDVLSLEWNRDANNLIVGDRVYIDRKNNIMTKLINDITKTEEKIQKITGYVYGTSINYKSLNDEQYADVNNLEQQLKKDKLHLETLKKETLKTQLVSGTLVKINDNNTCDVLIFNTVKNFPINYVTKGNAIKKNVPMYMEIESIKSTNLLPITSWIKIVLRMQSIAPTEEEWLTYLHEHNVSEYFIHQQSIKITFQKERMLKLYDKALEKYNSSSEEMKHQIDQKVAGIISKNQQTEFINGVPNKGPLIYIYPPQVPDEKASEADYEEYSDQMQIYLKEVTPETNPFIKLSTSIPNALVDKFKETTYNSLKTAVKSTPIYGFFKINELTTDEFQAMVLNHLTEKEKRHLQLMLLSPEEIKMHDDMFFQTSKDTKNIQKERQQSRRTEYDINPETNKLMTLISKLKDIDTNQDEFGSILVNILEKVKLGFDFVKVVGDEIFFQKETDAIFGISKTKLIDQLIQKILETRINNETTDFENIDRYSSSIVWALRSNPTFQLIDVDKNASNSFIVHGDDSKKYRIRAVNHLGKFKIGWSIHPLKMIENNEIVHEYKYPIVMTTFNEYLVVLRNNLVIKYNKFKKANLDPSEFMSSSHIMRHITYISDYLYKAGYESENFYISKIKQDDVHMFIRKEQKEYILQSLKNLTTVDFEILEKLATDIEHSVYNIFTDILTGEIGKQLKQPYARPNILDISDKEHFEKLRKFQKSVPLEVIVKVMSDSTVNNEIYNVYKSKIGDTIYNIFNINNSVDKLLNGKLSIDDVVNRNLTTVEKNESSKELNLDDLLNWIPDTYTLNYLKTKDLNAFNKMMQSFNSISSVDLTIVNIYEQDTNILMTTMFKKLALSELVKLKLWRNALDKSEHIDLDKRFNFLLSERNKIRNVNNITARIRINSLVKIQNNIYKKCGDMSNSDKLDEISENIESACYSLTKNENEYDKLISTIIDSKPKLCTFVSDLVSQGSGPVDIIIRIADLYLDYKSNDIKNWDGIKELPTVLLQAIIKVSNSMIQAKERIVRGEQLIAKNPSLDIKEYRLVRDSDGNFTTEEIIHPYAREKEIEKYNKAKRSLYMSELVNIIKYDYVPKLNETLRAELQHILDSRDILSKIKEQLGARGEITDIKALQKMDYDELRSIYDNFYSEPEELSYITIDSAKRGVVVYPLRQRGVFLVGGNFPLDVKSYRYRDVDGKIKTKLIDICKLMDVSHKDYTYPLDMSIYDKTILGFENDMLGCIKTLKKIETYVKLNFDNQLINSKEVLNNIINGFDMYERIEKSVINYFMTYGGDRSLFVNGGTKEEFDAFFANTLFKEGIEKLFGVNGGLKYFEKPTKFVSNIPSNMITDDNIEVNILKNGDQEIYRRLFHSKTQEYPVPFKYDNNNFPHYTKDQKILLAFLIETGVLSAWYKNKIKIIKHGNDITFEGNLPFVIDETKKGYTISHYYVEQIFKDPKYGLPIITRIGIIPKRIPGAEGPNIITKIPFPKEEFETKEEQLKIQYFKNTMPEQSESFEFKINKLQQRQKPSQIAIIKKSGYAFLDSRSMNYKIKYEPDDVWTWDPTKDYKAGTTIEFSNEERRHAINKLIGDPIFGDNEIKEFNAKFNDKDLTIDEFNYVVSTRTWFGERNRQLAIIKEWLKKVGKAGSSSSAFIAAKNEATLALQKFRLNLPSQKYNEMYQVKFNKPPKTTEEVDKFRVFKQWKKMFTLKGDKLSNPKIKALKQKKLKNDIITKAKEIELFDEDMNKMKPSEILELMKTKFEEESKINHRLLMEKIGNLPQDTNDDEDEIKAIDYFNLNENIRYITYIEKMIKFKIIVISNEVLEIIKNPRSLFKNYNRYKITFYDDDTIASVPVYKLHNQSHTEVIDVTFETIYEIIKNMEFTTKKIFNKDFISDFSIFVKLSEKDKKEYRKKYPMIIIIEELNKQKQQVTIWNILTTIVDLWYTHTIPRNISKEREIEYLSGILKYNFDKTIEITMEDTINYLGDSYYQNLKYNRGIRRKSEHDDNILLLGPGYKFEQFDEKANTFENNGIGRNNNNSYLILYKNSELKSKNYDVGMYVVGPDLHKNEDVTHYLARRCALVYNVNIADVDPLFSSNEPNIIGSNRTFAVQKEDVLKFLQKGGKPFGGIEFTDRELKYRDTKKMLNYFYIQQQKVKYTKRYKEATIDYIKARAKGEQDSVLNEIIYDRHLSIEMLKKYIEKVDTNEIPASKLKEEVENFNIDPDFLDINWPIRKKILDRNFVKTGLPLSNNDNTIVDKIVKIENKEAKIGEILINNFLKGTKRNIYLNISIPTTLLYPDLKIN